MKYLFKIILFITIFSSNLQYSYSSAYDIGIISKYLENLDKVGIFFTQHSDQNTSKGVIIIKKPNQFRVNYDKPNPILIVGGKNFISLYDYNLEELSRIKNDQNIFKIIFSGDNLKNSVNIEYFMVTDKTIDLAIEHKSSNYKSILSFSNSPIKMEAITIPVDGVNFDNGSIFIKIDKIEKLSNLPNYIFNIKNPDQYGKPKCYSSEELINILR